mgnify:CR=1 FL=1
MIKEVVEIIKKKTDIKIEIIDGKKEAAIIASSDLHHFIKTNENYLYVDVGGGSTEISFFTNDLLTFKKSFNIGTIRLLKNMVTTEEWDELKETIRLFTKNQKEVIAIGSGGNINKIFSLSKRKEDKPLSLEALRDYYKELSAVGVEERMIKYNLRQDRADVIVPALQIYTNA